MKRICYDGVAAVTSDEVAEALVDFAVAAARYHQHERVTLPVLVAGRDERLTMLIGPAIPLGVFTAPAEEGLDDAAAADAAALLRRRTLVLTDPLQPIVAVPSNHR